MQLRSSVTVAGGVILASLTMASSAHALGFTNLSSAPADTAAGAHSDFSQHIEFTSAGDDVKNLVVHLPPGQVGDPTATPKCTVDQLNANACPADTQVGVTTTSADLFVAVVPVPLTIQGKVYNLVPQPGEPARFGIVLQPDLPVPPTILQASASLRQDDFGLDTTINDIPNTASGLPIDIKALDLTLFGFANEGTPAERSFMRNPTSCGEAVTGFEATSYTGSTASTPATGSASFTPTDCDELEFSPELTASTGGAGETSQAGHPFYTTVISQGETEAGLAVADVTLPLGITADNNALGNQCPLETFESDTCPENTLVGTVEAESPLLQSPLTGTVALLTIGENLGVGIQLEGELEMKLIGKLGFAGGGRAKNLFDTLPDIPISRFELTVEGGPGNLLLATQDLCASSLFTDAIFDGHNGAHTTVAAPTSVVGCAPPEPPTASVRLRKAGAEHPRLRFRGNAGSAALRSARIKLPRGLRFAEGADLEDGVTARDEEGVLDGDAIEATRRKLTVTTPSGAGSDVLKVRVGGHALVRTGGLDDPEFPLRLIDVDGLATNLTG